MSLHQTYIKGLHPGDRFPTAVGFSIRKGHWQFSRSSLAALVELNRSCPEWGGRFLKCLKGFGPELKSVIFPLEISRPQNRELAKRLVTEPAFLKQFLKEGVLDLSRADFKRRPGYLDRTADFPEKKLYLNLSKILAPDNLALIAQDQEVGDLALFSSLWQLRVMVYKAQYLVTILRGGSFGAATERETANHTAASLLGYARQFTVALHSSFPFGAISEWRAYGDSLATISSLLNTSFSKPFDLGTANAALVSLTTRLEEACERQEKGRIGRERYKSTGKQTRPLADGINDAARTKYGVKISPEGVWSIPQTTFEAVGAVLRRKLVAAQVDESAVVRRMQHEIDGIDAERQENEGIIQAFRGRDGEPDHAVLAGALETLKLDRAAPKVQARLLIGLAADLLEVANSAATIPEMTAAGRKLVKFSRSMLAMAVRQLERRNRTLNDQLPRLEVKKRILEVLVAKRQERFALLRTAATPLTGNLMDDDFMSIQINLTKMHDNAIAAYRTVQDDSNLEAGVVAGKKCLQELIVQTKKLRTLLQDKGRLIKSFKAFRPASDHEFLENLAALNLRIMAVRTALLAAGYFLDYHLEHRFSPAEPDEPTKQRLGTKVTALWAQQNAVKMIGAGFVSGKDVAGLEVDLYCVPDNDNPTREKN